MGSPQADLAPGIDTAPAPNATARRLTRAATALSKAPATVAFLVGMWAIAVATSSVLHGPSPELRRTIGAGTSMLDDGHIWTALTSALWTQGLDVYLLTTGILLAVCVPLEGRLGSRKFVGVALASQFLGSVAGVAIVQATLAANISWAPRLDLEYAVGPMAAIVGVTLAATSTMSALWGRRIRLGLLALLITLALFSGHLLDYIRLFGALTGLALAPLMVRGHRGNRGPHPLFAGTRREGRILVAIVLAASALGPILAALSPHAMGPLNSMRDLFSGAQSTPDQVRALCAAHAGGPDCRGGLLGLRLGGVGPTVLTLMPSIFVLVLSDGLRRGRRGAWFAAVLAQCTLIGLAVLNLVLRYSAHNQWAFHGRDGGAHLYRAAIPMLLPLAILIMLIATRRYFTVPSPKGTYLRLFGFLGAITAALFTAYVLIGSMLADDFDRPPSMLDLAVGFPERLIPPRYLQWLDPRFLPSDFVATLLFEWTGVLFWIALSVAMLATFRKPSYDHHPSAAQRARTLLQSTGGNSMSWMTTWAGNEYWFTQDGRSYIAYRVASGVALTTGGPVGRPEHQRQAVVEFARYCAHNGWTPCFYSVFEPVKEITDELGWVGIKVAEETVLPLGELAFTGKKFQDIRTALNHARKAGITAEWVDYPNAPLALTDQIQVISEEWVASKGMPEMGFTLGGLDEVADPDVRCLVAIDEHRTIHGVTSWLPVYRDGQIVGWTLDFMRRRTAGFRPSVEFLLASAALLLQEEGAEFMSLSGAPLAKVNVRNEPGLDEASGTVAVLDKALDVLGRALEPVYGFRSLLAFKSKFAPQYVPVYMAFEDPAALPSIGTAVSHAYLPTMSASQGMRLLSKLVRR